MFEMITACVNMASTVLTFIQTQELLAHVNKMRDIQNDLVSERAKGVDADDAKIEGLYASFKIEWIAYCQQASVVGSSKSSPAPAAAPAPVSS